MSMLELRALLNTSIADGTVGPTLERLYEGGDPRSAPALLRLVARVHADGFDDETRAALTDLGLLAPPTTSVSLPAPAMVSATASHAAIQVREGVDLEKIEADLAGRYGAEMARGILLAALDAEGLGATEAAQALAARRYRDNPRWTIIEGITRELLAGVRLVDTNQNGLVDEQDAVLTTDERGVRIERISAQLANRARLGQAFMEAAAALGSAGVEFGLLDQHRFNAECWQPASEEPSYATVEVREGVRSSEALLDILLHPEAYAYECKTAQTTLFYMAILSTIGPDDFDAAFPRLRLGPQEHCRWSFAPEALGIKDLLRSTGSGLRPNPDAPPPRPGEAVYFQNWDVAESAAERGWAGENTIYLGLGLYYGHPFGVASAEQIIDFLNTQEKVGEQRSASMSPKRTFLDEQIFDLDVTAGD